jgi:hypothetical protein
MSMSWAASAKLMTGVGVGGAVGVVDVAGSAPADDDASSNNGAQQMRRRDISLVTSMVA